MPHCPRLSSQCFPANGEALVVYILDRFHDPDTAIGDIWHIEDVQGLRPDLTDAQALQVLHMTSKEMDATIGINWDVLSGWADCLFPLPDA